jgi:hypothetical protein
MIVMILVKVTQETPQQNGEQNLVALTIIVALIGVVEWAAEDRNLFTFTIILDNERPL